jgi:hypothetical protein
MGLLVRRTTKNMSELQTKDTYTLPTAYNDNEIILLARDPHWLYVYWQISETRKSNFINEFGEGLWERSVPVLKVTNISKNTNTYIRINDFSNNWFINVEDTNSLYLAELGRKIADQFFINLASSNYISTPSNSISTNSNTHFIDYRELQHSKLNLNAGKMYDSATIHKASGLIFGPSSSELFGPDVNESLLGISSSELLNGDIKQHLGISSLSLIK